MKTIAFFNTKGGVGKTTLVFHLAHMFAERGVEVLAVDVDPQANLTSMFLDEGRLEEVWTGRENTIYQAMRPLLDGDGDIGPLKIEPIRPGLSLVASGLELSKAEGELGNQWSACLDRDPRAFRLCSAIWRIIQRVAAQTNASLILLDLAPNLGAVNRSTLIAAEKLIIPMTPDFLSNFALEIVGGMITGLREGWRERALRNPIADLSMPAGLMEPSGYVVLWRGVGSRPMMANQAWMNRIPVAYRRGFDIRDDFSGSAADDPKCLALLKSYHSLISLSQQAHKPVFNLRPADGAIGAHGKAVAECYDAFHLLAKKIADAVGVQLK